MITGKPLQTLIAEQIDGNDLQLPVFNPVAVKLQEALRQDDITIEQIETLIMEDQALAGHILRTANAAFYKGLSEITTIDRAVIRLGAQQVANIAMLVTQKQSYQAVHPVFGDYMEKLWQQAFACAVGCRWLARRCGHASQAETAFLAGLLHDIGKLVILKVLEQLYQDEAVRPLLTAAAVAEILDSALHNDYGYSLMQAWNLPEQYCLIARDHHQPAPDGDRTLLLAVQLLDQVCAKLGVGMSHTPDVVLAATGEAQALGLSELQLAELEIQIEDSLQLEI